jgi:hypothetical protein
MPSGDALRYPKNATRRYAKKKVKYKYSKGIIYIK